VGRIAEAVSSAPPPLPPGAARGGGPADELDRLYPDSFQDSELGPIPAGWRVGCVDDEFDVTIGQSPPGHTYNEVGDGLPFCQGRSNFGFRFPNRRVFCTAALRIAKTGDTLIRLRAPVGDVNMAAEECAIGRGVAARPKTGSRSYSYQFMRAQADVFACFEAEGTVFGSIGKKDFHSLKCVAPPRGLVEGFEQIIAPLDGRMENLDHESRTLAALRDALLPKLLSGGIDVWALAARPAEAEATGQPAEKPSPRTWTETVIYIIIGHSNHPIDRFIGLLRQHGITAIADVRSAPDSRHNPQFNRNALAAALRRAGIARVPWRRTGRKAERSGLLCRRARRLRPSGRPGPVQARH
jgi:hypothetical protein